eukprot:jgi/Mesen1/2917/ME000175S02073
MQVIAHSGPYSQAKYGDYGQMFIDLLRDPGEEWHVFEVVEGHFPSAQELDQFDGFVITGSRHDAHADEEWILRLCGVLRELHAKRTKVLGICFGHQVLSRALGGRTGRSLVGWELGVKEVPVTPALRAKPYAAGLPPVLRILGIHQDQVAEVPPGGELLGQSKRTGVEMFCVGESTLAMQGHPEFNKDIVRELIDTRSQIGAIPSEGLGG